MCVTVAPWGASTASAYRMATNNMTHNLIRILPGTHLYTWVESSNVDKVPRYGRESNLEPFDSESRVQSNIPRQSKFYNLSLLCIQGPHIAMVTLAAFECRSVDFPEPPLPRLVSCLFEVYIFDA